jgi:SAM-dependent methyltransferase
MRAISQIALSKSFCNFKSGDYVLDLGSGFGDVLIASKKILINPRLAVIELTKGAIDFFKKNYDVKVFGSLKAFSAECSAKIIVLSHCLEHLPNWVDALDYWISKLKSGGVLFLYLPHYDQEYWRPWNNRKHVHCFTPNIIKDYLVSNKLIRTDFVFVGERDLNHSFIAVAEKL